MLRIPEKDLAKFAKKAGLEDYKGCRNCANQIEPCRMCEWAEKGGDGCVYLICPRWVKRERKNAKSRKN